MEVETSGESLLSLMTWAMWGLVALAALFYFAYSYVIEILAQKLDEPRWMAWVPIANSLLIMKLVGWEKWFWVMLAGYAVALGGMFLPAPLMMVSAIAAFPLVILAFVLSLAYFPKLAVRRELPMTVGLWVVLPQFFPPVVEAAAPGIAVWVSLLASAVALGAIFKIVFHDGRPQYAPHPIAYAMLLFGVVVTGVSLHALPGRLLGDEAFQQAWREFAAELEATPIAGVGGWAGAGDAAQEAVAEVAPEASPHAEPDPVEIADACPEGTSEVSGPRNGGRAWWCETEGKSGRVRHGPSRSWHDNGFLESEGVYDHGRRTGTWTRYWRSGGRQVQAVFRDDVQHGWMHRWDVYGGFETAVRYADGEPLGPS